MEVSFDWFYFRDYGWSEIGEKCTTFTHKYHRKTYTLIAAISYLSIHYEILDTSKEKVNAKKFINFISNLAQFTSDDVIYYMDNCKIYHTSEVKSTLNFYGIKYLFSSPYSPDYNPIELMFAFIKKRIKDFKDLSLVDAITKQFLKFQVK